MIADLMSEIEVCLAEGGPWCSIEKAQTLAAIVLSVRPRVVVEIGVWMGGSLVPMLLALKRLGAGQAIAIDPYARDASLVGMDGENAAWWGRVDHEQAYRVVCDRLTRHNLFPYCSFSRMSSDQVTPPDVIDLLHVDGNHGEQAFRDVQRFASRVRVGGFLVLDDVGWSGGAVDRAREFARVVLGFDELYPLGTGCVMQRGAIRGE